MKNNILLTNDDGIDSPLLELLYWALVPIANVFLVVPLHEKSWQGKSMTRFGKVEKQTRKYFDHEVVVLTGTPADCTNYGIHNLGIEVDLVISGVNFGCNASLGYAWSSGTLGACIEANLVGKPAIALSQFLTEEDYNFWVSDKKLGRNIYQQFSLEYPKVLRKIIALYEKKLSVRGLLSWSFNFPEQVCVDTKILPARLAKTFYGRYFKDIDESSITYDLEHECRIDSSNDVDMQVLKKGYISLSKIDIFSLGQELDF